MIVPLHGMFMFLRAPGQPYTAFGIHLNKEWFRAITNMEDVNLFHQEQSAKMTQKLEPTMLTL